MTLAGVLDRWRDEKTGVRVESCTIVTTAANELLESVPHDRMPVCWRAMRAKPGSINRRLVRPRFAILNSCSFPERLLRWSRRLSAVSS